MICCVKPGATSSQKGINRIYVILKVPQIGFGIGRVVGGRKFR